MKRGRKVVEKGDGQKHTQTIFSVDCRYGEGDII